MRRATAARWTPSRPILPHVDFYVPNETEAAHQTGLHRAARDDPGVPRRRRSRLARHQARRARRACSVRSPANSSMWRWSSRQGPSSTPPVPAIASTVRCSPGSCADCRPPMRADSLPRPARSASQVWARPRRFAATTKRHGSRDLVNQTATASNCDSCDAPPNVCREHWIAFARRRVAAIASTPITRLGTSCGF